VLLPPTILPGVQRHQHSELHASGTFYLPESCPACTNASFAVPFHRLREPHTLSTQCSSLEAGAVAQVTACTHAHAHAHAHARASPHTHAHNRTHPARALPAAHAIPQIGSLWLCHEFHRFDEGNEERHRLFESESCGPEAVGGVRISSSARSLRVLSSAFACHVVNA
jgi:hypothetical protein